MKRNLMIIGLICLMLFIISAVTFAEGNDNTAFHNIQTSEVESDEGSCTGIYVGKKASADGRIYIGHCDDYPHGGYCYKNVVIQERIENQPGRYLKDQQLNISLALPATSFHYVTMSCDPNTAELTNSGAVNEYGVAISDSITVYPQEWVIKADPKKGGGLHESIIPSLIAGNAKTAKEGVDVIIDYLDKYGAQDFGIALIADQNEAWLFEIFSGSRYVAVKLPDDEVAVFGNESLLKTLDEYEETIYSEDLEAFAEENGHAVKDKEGRLRLDKTFINPAEHWEHMRTWVGHEILAPSASRSYHLYDEYPLTYRPDQPVDIHQLMAIFRNRYDDTPYSETHKENLNHLGKWYPIGNQGSAEAHLLEVDPAAAQNKSATMYVALSEAEHSVFIPISSMTARLPAAFTGTDSVYTEANGFRNLYWSLQRLNSFAGKDRPLFSAGVRSAWAYLENYYVDEMRAAQAELTSDKAFQLLEAMSAEVLDTAHVLFDQLTDYTMANNEVADTDHKKIDPVCQVPVDHLIKEEDYQLNFDPNLKGATLTKDDIIYHFSHFSTKCEKTVGSKTEEIDMNTFAVIQNGRLFIPIFAEPICGDRIDIPADQAQDTNAADLSYALYILIGCLLFIGTLAIVSNKCAMPCEKQSNPEPFECCNE